MAELIHDRYMVMFTNDHQFSRYSRVGARGGKFLRLADKFRRFALTNSHDQGYLPDR